MHVNLLTIVAASLFAPVSEAETQALAQRQRISSAEVVVETSYQSFSIDNPSAPRFDRHVRIHCFLGPTGLRTDYEEMSDSLTQLRFYKGQRSVTYRTKDEHFWLYGAAEDRTPVAAILRRSDSLAPEEQDELLDPRKLGLVASPPLLMYQFPIDRMVTNTDRVNWSEKPSRHGKWESIEITLEKSNGLRRTVTIVPELDYNVVRMDSTFERGSTISNEVLEVEVDKVESNGIWFPKRLRYIQHINGKLTTNDTSTVTVLSINERLSDDTFSLSGVNFPAGWPISDLRRDDGYPVVWDGKQLISAEQPLQVAESGRNWPLLALAMLMAAVAALLSWRVWLGWREARG